MTDIPSYYVPINMSLKPLPKTKTFTGTAINVAHQYLTIILNDNRVYHIIQGYQYNHHDEPIWIIQEDDEKNMTLGLPYVIQQSTVDELIRKARQYQKTLSHHDQQYVFECLDLGSYIGSDESNAHQTIAIHCADLIK